MILESVIRSHRCFKKQKKTKNLTNG